MYTMEQLATLTGLTTRTLRNYLKAEILQGSKDTGIWQFTEEQVSEFVRHPAVYPSIQAKHHAMVYDFLARQDHSENEMCILLDRTLGEEEAKELTDFFCHAVSGRTHIRFAFSYESGKARYILKGTEADVSQIMREFYQSPDIL